MSALRWALFTAILAGLYAAWVGERSWLLAGFLAAVILAFLWTLRPRRTPRRRAVSRWFEDGGPDHPGAMSRLDHFDLDHRGARDIRRR